MKRYLPLGVIAIVLLAAIAGATVLYRSKKPVVDAIPFTADTPATTAATPAQAAAGPVQQASAVPAQSPTPSTPVAPGAIANVLVEEYGDYQCPPCGVLYPDLKKIEADYGNRIEFIFHNFPLTRNHKNALAAAQAAEAARLQGKFVKMHDMIYETQNAWKDLDDPHPIFLKYAKDIGLDVARFTKDCNGPEVKQRIDMDTERAMALGVQGTPTVLLDGRQLKPEMTTGDGIRKGIDLLLSRKTASP